MRFSFFFVPRQIIEKNVTKSDSAVKKNTIFLFFFSKNKKIIEKKCCKKKNAFFFFPKKNYRKTMSQKVTKLYTKKNPQT